MFNNHYSSTNSIEMAVDMTFGGDNACEICENVSGALNQKNEGKANDYMILEFKPVIMGLASKFNFIFQRVYRSFIDLPNSSIAKRVELPFIPPPRV